MVDHKIKDIVISAAIAAGKAILTVYSRDFEVEFKEDKSPLTEADKVSHEVIMNFLEKTPYPVLSEEGKDIEYSERSSWKRYWCVDPIDGTKEFIKKNGEFTVNIALIEDGVPIFGVVYAPVLQDLYLGEANVEAYRIKVKNNELNTDSKVHLPEKLPSVYTVVGSRSHRSSETEAFIDDLRSKYGEIDFISKGSSLKLCMVAEGSAHIYPRHAPTMEWDTAAGHAVVLGAGGYVHDYNTKSSLVYNKENLLNPWFTVGCR